MELDPPATSHRAAREAETDERRRQREERQAQYRKEQASAEANALDAAVKKSIKQFGP